MTVVTDLTRYPESVVMQSRRTTWGSAEGVHTLLSACMSTQGDCYTVIPATRLSSIINTTMFNQKRLYVIALCVYLVLTVLLFAQLSSPSVADPSHPPKDRPSYHDLFEEPVRDGKWTTSNWMSKLTDVLPNSSPFSTVHEPSELPWPRPPSPNPYRAPGTFLSDNHHLENNQWVPIDASIPPAPALLKTLQQGPEAAGPEYSWFQNRTVLLLSDSMGREHLHAFCTWWTFREPEIFGPQHESYPKFALEMEAKYSPGREYNFAMYGRPMRCHHEAWNFTMFYYFMGSFDDTAEQVEPGWSVGGFWDPRTVSLRLEVC